MITYLNTRHDPYYGMHFQEMSIRILAQFFGGLWGYSMNQTVWNLYLTPNHWYQSYNTSFGNCWTFLTVDTTTGFFIGIIEAQIFFKKKIPIVLGNKLGNNSTLFVRCFPHEKNPSN